MHLNIAARTSAHPSIAVLIARHISGWLAVIAVIIVTLRTGVPRTAAGSESSWAAPALESGMPIAPVAGPLCAMVKRLMCDETAGRVVLGAVATNLLIRDTAAGAIAEQAQPLSELPLRGPPLLDLPGSAGRPILSMPALMLIRRVDRDHGNAESVPLVWLAWPQQ